MEVSDTVSGKPLWPVVLKHNIEKGKKKKKEEKRVTDSFRLPDT